MTEEFIIRLVNNDFAEGTATATGGGGKSSGGSSAGLIGKLVGVASIAAIGITSLIGIVGPVISNILQPINAVLKGIARMVGELLRPIVEVVLILLRPILIILRPIIQTFKSLMSPFLAIAREFSSIAQQQFQSGDVTGAIQTSLTAVSTIIGPFVVSLTTVALQLASQLIIGAVGTIMTNLIEVVKAFISPFPFGDAISQGLTLAQDAISGGLQGATESVNELLLGAAEGLLSFMEADALAKLEELRGRAGDEATKMLVETPESLLAEGNSLITKGTGDMSSTFSTALTNMGAETDNKMGNKIPTTFGGALSTMESAVEEFSWQMQQAAERINSIEITGPKVDGDDDTVQIGFVNIKTG